MSEQRIKNTLDSFYEIISGYKGESRDWERLRTLFWEGATLTPYIFSEEEGDKTKSYDIEGYIERLSGFFIQHDLHERGSNYHVHIYDNIASVSSEYTAEIKMSNVTYMKKGINLVQLLYNGTDWKIVSMLWENTSGESVK